MASPHQRCEQNHPPTTPPPPPPPPPPPSSSSQVDSNCENNNIVNCGGGTLDNNLLVSNKTIDNLKTIINSGSGESAPTIRGAVIVSSPSTTSKISAEIVMMVESSEKKIDGTRVEAAAAMASGAIKSAENHVDADRLSSSMTTKPTTTTNTLSSSSSEKKHNKVAVVNHHHHHQHNDDKQKIEIKNATAEKSPIGNSSVQKGKLLFFFFTNCAILSMLLRLPFKLYANKH